MTETFLPQECLELIFNSLSDQRHFESLSLVSHDFLSITNNLRSSLRITAPSLPLLPRLLLRFNNLSTLDLSSFNGDPDSLLSTLSRSQINLLSLNISNLRRFPHLGLRQLGLNSKNLRDLICSNMWGLQDEDLVVIAESFPSLEALDISFPQYDSRFSSVVTDCGVIALSEKLNKLTKVDLSGKMFITDKSLVSISMNCVLLREFAMRECYLVTQKGIGEAIKCLPNLVSLCFGSIGFPTIDSCFRDSLTCSAMVLHAIELSNTFISDELLHLLANACVPLNKLVISHCHNFTFGGICFLLEKCRLIEHLNLEGANFLSDKSMVELIQYLERLKYINLNFCSKLTDSTFFNLIRECGMLSDVRMETTNLGVVFDNEMELAMNPNVKCLHLARNYNLSDEFLKMVVLLCPNLQVLNVTSCPTITEIGIGDILMNCVDIQCLVLDWCRQISSLGIKDFKVERLEELRMVGLRIDDQTLATIADACSRLLRLNLYSCLYVTSNGLREVVEKCKMLREIKLGYCENVSVDILPWMVFRRPSLRLIVSPTNEYPTDSQQNLLLRHGCLVVGSDSISEDVNLYQF